MEATAQFSQLEVDVDEATSPSPRSKTPDANMQRAPLTPATPVRHDGISSAALGSAKSTTIEEITLDDLKGPIESDLSESQECKAADMLRFLFSFCCTDSGAAKVEHMEEYIKGAFEEVRKLLNKEVEQKGATLFEHLNQVIRASDESSMYSPLIKAFNYGLEKLSNIDVPQLPKFQKSDQVVFVRVDPKPVARETYLQGLYKPDIALTKWNLVEEQQEGTETDYSKSHNSDLCCSPRSSFPKSHPSWKDVLLTVEVKRGSSTASKAGGKESVDKPGAKEYTSVFGELEGDSCQDAPSSEPPSSPYVVRMARERRPKRSACGGSRGLKVGKETFRIKRGTTNPSGKNGGERGALSEDGKKADVPAKALQQPNRIQSAVYAAHRLSSSFNITHTINIVLVGTSAFFSWIDRQGAINTRVIDLLKDLPHFFLLLLILQRFKDVKWGNFTECSQSGVAMKLKSKVMVKERAKSEEGEEDVTKEEKVELLEAFFTAGGEDGQEREITFYPNDDIIYGATTLIGRGTSVIGGRMSSAPGPDDTQLRDRKKLRDANDIVVKTYWPEEARTSEVKILKKAEEYAEENEFIKNHIPEIVCHRDPEFLCSSTGTIRQFLCFPTGSCRILRMIASRRLQPIKELKEGDMLTAYLECFFCHYSLWKKGILHEDIGPANLMWDCERKMGVVNDFDLARFAEMVDASGKDNTGTLPFMALDLMSQGGLRGEILRLYRHDAEAFAWSLVYLCLTTVKNEKGENCSISEPNSLAAWFRDWRYSFSAKMGLFWSNYEDPKIPFVYQNKAKQLAQDLVAYWKDRFNKQHPGAAQVKNPLYEEPGNDQIFLEVLNMAVHLVGEAETKVLLGELNEAREKTE